MHTGNVTGNVTGDLNGAVTGNVTGNLTGDVTGNVTGDLTGDVTGSVTGNVTGNLTGNVTGNVTGDLTGNADTATAWATGRTISLTGEATGTTSSLNGTANVSAAVTLTNSSVIDKVLTGLQSPAGATISATDSMLVAFGKLQSQINGIAEGLQFQGSWNASTNTPTLTSSTGTQGHYYIVGVAGSTNLDGVTDWEVGDWAIFSTTGVWQRLDQTGVQGTGTTGNLTKWATGSTISDSIVSESGTALTVTGSLNTTLATTVDGNLTVGTDSLIVNSVSDAVSMAGILTVASPVINTGISGSAVLDDDTFGTANATTVATSESIKAYVDAQDQGSGTVGTIAKFATSTTFNNSVITQSSTDLFLGGETYIPSNQLIIGASNQNSGSEYIELDGSGNHIGGGNVMISHNRNLDIGTNFANSFGIWTTNQQRFLMSSGGTATFFKSVTANQGIFNSIANTYAGSSLILRDLSGANPMYLTSVVGNLAISNGGATDHLTISSGGNVGIGTSTFNATYDKLAVAGGINIQDDNAAKLEIGRYSSGIPNSYIKLGANSASLRFTNAGNSADLVTINNGGNVGIGTSTLVSTSQLTILGNYHTDFIRDYYGGNRAYILRFGANTASSGHVIGSQIVASLASDDVNGSLEFYTKNAGNLENQLTITSGGLVQVGDGTSQNTFLTTKSVAGWASGIKLTRGLGDGSSTANNNFGMMVTDNGWEVSTFTSPLDNTTGRSAKLTIGSNGVTSLNGSDAGTVFGITNTSSTTPYGMAITLTSGGNNTSEYFIGCGDSSQGRFYVRSNGNVQNTNNSYGAISDIKLKENISDATPKLNDLLTVKIRNYNLIGDDKKQIGVIAQELEEIFPSMIDESKDTENREVTDKEGNVTTEIVDLGTTTKSVKYSVFTPMLIKAIQEQQTIIDTLTARLDVLEKKA